MEAENSPFHNPPSYPRSICVFCKYSFVSSDKKNVPESRLSPNDYFCKKYRFSRTINPVTGKPSYYVIDREGVFCEFYDEHEFGLCSFFNADGQCSCFERSEEKSDHIMVLTNKEQQDIDSFFHMKKEK